MLVFITVILSEVVDYSEYTLGTRNESILFSMQTSVVKFAGAFSGFVSGIGLTSIGYVANQQQTPGAENGMRIIMFLIPAILSGLRFLIYIRGYKLTPEFNGKMRKEFPLKRSPRTILPCALTGSVLEAKALPILQIFRPEFLDYRSDYGCAGTWCDWIFAKAKPGQNVVIPRNGKGMQFHDVFPIHRSCKRRGTILLWRDWCR